MSKKLKVMTDADDSDKLAVLSGDINQEYVMLKADMESAFDRAVRIGGWLVEAKAACRHGQYEDWCKENVPFSKPQRNRFVKIALNLDILEQNVSREKHLLSINDAYQFIVDKEQEEKAANGRAELEKRVAEEFGDDPEHQAAVELDELAEQERRKAKVAREKEEAMNAREEWDKPEPEVVERSRFHGMSTNEMIGKMFFELSDGKQQAIIKIFKQEFHSDKGGDADQWEAILDLEERIKIRKEHNDA